MIKVRAGALLSYRRQRNVSYHRDVRRRLAGVIFTTLFLFHLELLSKIMVGFYQIPFWHLLKWGIFFFHLT